MSDDIRPWATAIVSLDGGDPPAEVKVVKGYGYPMIASENEKSVQVKFYAEDKNGNQRKYLPTAWLPKSEEKLFKLIKKASESKVHVYYRTEIRRKDNIDRSTPIEELTKDLDTARDSIFKGVAAVKVKESDDWIFAKAALTNPLEDPSNNRFQSAVNMAPRNKKASSTNGREAHDDNKRGVEPPVFVTVMYNGDINPGCLAVASPMGAYDVATKLLNDFYPEAKKNLRGVLARAILKMSGNLQMEIWGGEMQSPDMSANSFTRARHFVEMVIRNDEPISAETFNEETFGKWQKRVESESLKLWKWSIKTVEKAVEAMNDEEDSEED